MTRAGVSSAPTLAPPRKDRWAVLALAVAARMANAAQFQSIGATGPALLADPSLGIAYSGLGALIGAYMLPGIVLALPAGWLIVRYGERRIALAGLAFGGSGGALLTVVLATLVMDRFAGSRALVPALGAILAAWPLGIALGLMLLPVRALSPETRAIGMGIYYTFYYAGMAAFPPLAGLARDVTGFVPAPLVVAALFHGVAIAGIAAYAMHMKRPQPARTIP